jgi:signal transduction histidine kinase
MIAATFLVLMVALFLASGLILVSSFVNLEERDMKKDIHRVTDRIFDDIYNLSSRNRDYGSWDETYEYMLDKNKEFISSELVDGTFSSLGINLLSIIDNDMNLVFVKRFDVNNSKEIPLSLHEDKVLKSIHNQHLVDTLKNHEELQGIVMFDGKPMLISIRLILPSNEQGNSRGYILMGRYLDGDAVEYMKNITHVKFDVVDFKSIKSEKELEELNRANIDNNDVLIKRINKNTVEAYTVIKDIYREPAIVIKASSYREIFNQGLAAVRYLMLALLVIGIVFGYVAMVFMDKALIGRLLRLNVKVKEIGEREDYSLRVEVKGNDELSDLSSSVNNMLMKLESTITNLTESNGKLQELDNLKDEFIATVSHEIRTPLTSIIGFSKLNNSKFIKTILPEINMENKKIKKTCLQLRDNSDIIVSEAERLSQIVNDMLDISKIAAGKMEYKKQHVDIAETIENSIAAVEALFIEKKLKLVKEIENELPFITGDEDKLMQVLINLFSNAVKFTDGGSITCKANLVGREIKISVIDTGTGIAEADCEVIFEKFKQVGDHLTGKPRGTGLGLSISKSIIENHGGKVWVEKGMEKGSNFSFTLPVAE